MKVVGAGEQGEQGGVGGGGGGRGWLKEKRMTKRVTTGAGGGECYFG